MCQGILKEFWEILGKYGTLDGKSMGSKWLKDVWHISLPNSFSKVFERSKIKFLLQKNILLSLDPAMMVKLIGLIL